MVAICGKLRIEGEKIKCKLLLTIAIHKHIENEPPIIYIRNFNANEIQPNPMMGDFYEVVIGGVRVK